MCDKNHNHGLIEHWITPKESTRLRSKMVHLFPKQTMPAHTTGPGREEVLVCVFGTVRVTIGDTVKTVTAGEAVFIPENTLHAVTNRDEYAAQYCYIVSLPGVQEARDERLEALFDTRARIIRRALVWH